MLYVFQNISIRIKNILADMLASRENITPGLLLSKPEVLEDSLIKDSPGNHSSDCSRRSVETVNDHTGQPDNFQI